LSKLNPPAFGIPVLNAGGFFALCFLLAAGSPRVRMRLAHLAQKIAIDYLEVTRRTWILLDMTS
jgi:hypothetical protein